MSDQGQVDIWDAAESGDIDGLRTLLNKDPSRIDERDGEGNTPLMLALLLGHWQAAKYLLEAGADMTLRTPNDISCCTLIGMGPLSPNEEAIADMMHMLRPLATVYEAAEDGHEDVLRSRLAADPAAVNAPNSRGWTPLMHAAYCGRTAAVRILLDAGADPDAHDFDGLAAFFLSCNGYRGADLEARRGEIHAMLLAPAGTAKPAAPATAVVGPPAATGATPLPLGE